MKRISSRIILSLATLQLSAAGPPALAESITDIKCEVPTQQLKEDFDSQHTVEVHCAGARSANECANILRSIERCRDGILTEYRTACEKVSRLSQDVGTHVLQADSQEKIAKMLRDLSDRFQVVISQINRCFQGIKTQLDREDGPLGVKPRPGTAESVMTQDTERGQKNIMRQMLLTENRLMQQVFTDQVPTRVASPSARNNVGLFAGRNGVAYMRKLVNARKDAAKTQSTITGLALKAEGNVARNKPTPPPDSPPPPSSRSPGPSTVSSGGGDMLKTLTGLAGLATAGMGLANAMKKQNSDGAPPATSPTPNSTNTAPAAKPEPSVSKLNSDKAPAPASVGAAPKKASEDAPAPLAGVPGGPGARDLSDISKDDEPKLTHNGSTAASGKPGGPGGAPGGGGDDPAPAAGGQRDPSAAAGDQHKEDEAMQGIGSGGLGHGSGSSGSLGGSPPADPATAAAEEGMSNLLTEMKDAVSEGEAGTEPAPEGDSPEVQFAEDDLFPRVHAAYIRSLKQGRVLNGLGDKIDPNNP